MGKRIGLKGGPNYMVKDQQGQWKYPGQNTRIEGNDITMKGVPYPVWAQPNVGPPTLMNPGKDYYFPNADYVDEFPILGSTNPFNVNVPKSNVESLQWQPEEAPDVSRFGFLFPEKNEGNIIAGGGLNFNDLGTQFNATGILPMNNNPVFKGVGSLGVRQQINDRLNLGVNLEAPLLRNPVTGERIKQSPTAKFSLKYNFKDGGSLPKYQNEGELKKTIVDERNAVGPITLTDSQTDTKSNDKAFVYEDDDYNYYSLVGMNIHDPEILEKYNANIHGIYKTPKSQVDKTEAAFNKMQALKEQQANEQQSINYPEGSQLIQENFDPAFGTYGNYMLTPTGEHIPVGKTEEDYIAWKNEPKEKTGVHVLPPMTFEYGGSLPSYQSKGEINSIFDPRYEEYKKIRKENENIESLNKEIDAAKDAYDLRWSVTHDYTDSAEWKNSDEYKAFSKYASVIPQPKTPSQKSHQFKDVKMLASWGDTDWDAAKSPTIENYHRKLPRHSMTDDEYQQYISWAQTNNPEYFAEHNIEELLKGLPSQNIVVRSMINDLGYPTNNEESNFTINTDNIIEPQPTIEQVEQKQIEYKKLLQKDIIELTREKSDLQELEAWGGLNQSQKERLNQIQAMLQGDAGYVQDNMQYNQGIKRDGGDILPIFQFKGETEKNNRGYDWGQRVWIAGESGNTEDPEYLKQLDTWANKLKTSLPAEYKNYSTQEIKTLYDDGSITNTTADDQGNLIPSYNLDEFEVTPQSNLPYWDQITDSQKELILQSNKPTDPAIIEKYGYDPYKNNPMLRSALSQATSGYGLINPKTGKRNDTYTETVVDNIVKPGMFTAALPLGAQALPHAWSLGSQAWTGAVNPLLNTTIAGDVTVGGALDAYGLYHGATHLPGDIQNMYNDPNWSNALSLGLDGLGIGFGANAIGKQFIPTIKKGFAPITTKSTSNPILNTINKTDDVPTTLNQVDTDWTNLPDEAGVNTEFWPGTYIPKKPKKVDTQPSKFYGNEKYNQSLTEVNEQIAKQNELISEHNIKVNTGKASKDPKIREQFKDQTTLPYQNLKQPLENVDDHINPLIENFNNPAAREKLINLGIKDPDDFISYLMNEVQYTNVPGRGGYAGGSVGDVSGVDDLVNLGIGQHSKFFDYVPNQISHTGDHEIGHLLQRYMKKRGLNQPVRTYPIRKTDGTELPFVGDRTVVKPNTKFDEEASEFFRKFKKEDDWLSTTDKANYKYTQHDQHAKTVGNNPSEVLPGDKYKNILNNLTSDLNYANKSLESAKSRGYGTEGMKAFFKPKYTRTTEGKDFYKSVVEEQKIAEQKLREFQKRYPDETTYVNQTTHQHEPLAHLRELRNELHQNGIIKNFQDPIDEKMLMEFWKSDAGKQNRILSFLQPSAEGKKGIIDLVNRTPVVAGAVATGGLGVAVGSSGSNEGMQYGGQLPKAQDGKGNFIKKMSEMVAKAAPSEPATARKLEEMKLMQKLFEQRENTIPQEMLVRQAYKESTFDPEAVSSAGYKGIAQLGDAVIKDYKKATGETEVDPFDPEDATKVQKWYMDHLYNASFINKPNQSPIVRRAKTFAAYNWGRGNMSKFLNNQKEKGVDIYGDDMKWLESLPQETKDYVHKIVLGDNENWEEEYLDSKHDSISTTYYDQLFELPKKQTGDEIKTDSVYVSQGEIGPRIAAKFGITMKELLDANPGINPMMISKGTSINIPGAGTSIQQTVVEETITPVEQPVEQTIVTPPVTPTEQPVVAPSAKKEVVQQKPVVNTQNKITSVNAPIEPVITEQPKPIVEEETTEKLLPKIDFTQYEYKAEPSTTDVNLFTMPVESFMPPGDNTVVKINDDLTLGEHHYAYDPNKKEPPKPTEKESPWDMAMNWVDDTMDNLHRGYVKYMDGDVYSTEEVDVDINLEEEKSPSPNMDKVDLFNARLTLNAKEGETPPYVDGVSGETNIQESPDLNKVNLIKPTYKDLGTVKDSKGNLMMYQNSFDAKNGFNYVPIKNYGKSDGNTQYSNVKGIAHFLLDSDLTDGYKHPYAKKMITQQLEGEPVAPGSTVTDGYFPVYEKLENGQVNIKYLKKDEIKDYASIASPLRQYKWSDLNWDGRTSAQGFQSTVSSIPTNKSYTKGGRKSNETHLIFPTSKSRGGKNAYGRFGGTGVIFFIERPNGQREAIEMAGSINMIKETANEIMKKYKLKPEELIFGYHDVGSFSARPQANNGKLDFNQWSGFNKASNPHVGGALAFPSMKAGGEMSKNEIYKNYIKGKYDNTDKLAFGKEVYDKLNRLHYKDAKKLGMHIPNYVMTHVVGKGNK